MQIQKSDLDNIPLDSRIKFLIQRSNYEQKSNNIFSPSQQIIHDIQNGIHEPHKMSIENSLYQGISPLKRSFTDYKNISNEDNGIDNKLNPIRKLQENSKERNTLGKIENITRII